MNLDDWKFIFISISIILIIIAFLPVSNAIISKREEQFITLAILGEDNKAENYYPHNDPFIDIGAIMNWSIYVYNNMGEIKYISLQIKILNNSIASPNTSMFTPSSATTIYEIRHILKNKETKIYPLSWSIIDYINEQIDLKFYTSIKTIVINQDIIETQIIAINGESYRMVIELWVLDENLNDFSFKLSNSIDYSCVWNQVWFNLKLSD